MTRTFRSTWSVLISLFLIMIPIQFYLAGHGAMEGANVATHVGDKGIHIRRTIMSTAWDPHSAFGTLMLLVSLFDSPRGARGEATSPPARHDRWTLRPHGDSGHSVGRLQRLFFHPLDRRHSPGQRARDHRAGHRTDGERPRILADCALSPRRWRARSCRELTTVRCDG
jgi:hypothetical protein